MNSNQKDYPRTILWRRHDLEGLDACSIDVSCDGYRISGSAIFHEDNTPARFEYEVVCQADWSCQSAHVKGWYGSTEKEFVLLRKPEGHWTVGGSEIAEAQGLLDVDLGFTPATNTNAIRRLGLDIGQEAKMTAIWLDTETWRFKPLQQVYRRLSATRFSYSSPTNDYAATLVTDDFGFVRSYPELWTAVPGRDVDVN